MYKIGVHGKFEEVPPLAESVINGDIQALNTALDGGTDINRRIKLGRYIEISPLSLALTMNVFPSVQWLVEHRADLNEKGAPAFLIAVRYCTEEVARYVAAKGADIHSLNNVKSDAFCEALYGEKTSHLRVIEELGHTARKYGGQAFRQAVGNRQYKALEFFLKNGVDINYNKPDQVYPFKPTPLCVAARYVDLQMVKYLAEHGADVTMAEKDGARPYTIAVEKGDQEMADYLKGLEPPAFHSLENKLYELRKFKLPQGLLDLLQGPSLRFAGSGEGPYAIKYIDFFSLLDTVEMKLKKQTLVRLSREVDHYGDLIVVWNPRKKLVGCVDLEHQSYADLARFDEFIKEPVALLENAVENGAFA